jgi:hypothetical protein
MLNILPIILISFIPVVFWAYIFSNISEKELNKKRFIIWIFAWGAGVIPILYMSKIVDFIKIKSIDFFEYASNIEGIFSSLSFWLSLSLFLGIIVLLSFIIWIVFRKDIWLLSAYFKNFLLFLFFVWIISTVFYLLNLVSTDIWFLNNNLENIYFWKTIFNTFKLVIFYYILIAFIEEASKHFNFIWTSILDIKNIRDWVIYAIFVALWFSFIENILYFNSLYIENWLSFELTKTYFFRSIFSIMVHVFCSSVIAYFFTKAYLLYKENNKLFPYLKVFLLWLSIWILLHFIFDFSVTLGFNFVIILYFIVWYLYVSSIFYKD